MWVCIWRRNSFHIRMLSLQWSKRRIKTKTSFSPWTEIEVLLLDDDILTEMQNLQIFKSVQLYIKRTKRLTHLWSQYLLSFKKNQSRCFHFTQSSMITKKDAYTFLYYIISWFLLCTLCASVFFTFHKNLFINVVYCNLLLLTHVLL